MQPTDNQINQTKDQETHTMTNLPVNDKKSKMTKGRKIAIGVVSALVVAGLVGGGIYLATRQGSNAPTTVVENNANTGNSSTALVDGENKIKSGGTYTFTGSTSNGKIEVDTTESVKIVLDNVSITNPSGAAIKCKEGSNVTVELVGESTLTSTDKGDSQNDPANVISSDANLIMTGTGSATLTGNGKGIKADGDLTIEGGTYNINAPDDGLRADGKITINGGNISIKNVAEGIEATNVVINGGTIYIEASDDGINATNKSTNYSIAIEINGGEVTIVMGQGDTDAIDSNGDLYINGGTLNITAQSPFDYDGTAKYTGGTMIINGQTTTEITNQFGGEMGGDMMPGGQTPPEQSGQTQSGQAQGQTPPQQMTRR